MVRNFVIFLAISNCSEPRNVKIRSMLKFLLVRYYVLGWSGDGNTGGVFVEVAIDTENE